MQMNRLVIGHAEWGLYWLANAVRYPEWNGACLHNAAMTALHIMALEAAGGEG